MPRYEWEDVELAVRRKSRWLLAGFIIAVLLLVLVKGSFVVVGPGERAVVFSKVTGVEQRSLPEGTHLLLPLVQQATVYDVKTSTYTMSSQTSEGDVRGDDSLSAVTADGLTVWMDLSVRYHPDPEVVWELHREIGPEYRQKVVRPQVRSEARMVVARYPVLDVYSGKRETVAREINDRLRESFARSHLILDEVLLRKIRFSEAFQAAIERKQVAMQEAKKMDYVLQQAEKEKEQKIVEARGEAEAIKLVADALRRNPELIRYEYVRNLPEDTKVMITDTQTIVSLGDILRKDENQ